MPIPTDTDTPTPLHEDTNPQTRPTDENPRQEPQKPIPGLSADGFDEWWTERQFAANIREGKHYFNGPSPIPDPRRHSPSQLLQCSRKTYYKQHNAPSESSDPHGIFWFGSKFEEEVIVPFLEERVATEDQYLTNSLWIDFTTNTNAGDLRIKGATDPVIVNTHNEPQLLTEIKTKRDTEQLTSPDQRHRAQAHAYMAGLSQKYDTEITTAVIVYASRTTFELTPFTIQFDTEFWENTVLDWATTHTTYRLNNELPPPKPQQDWECNYCDYKERCGQGDREFTNVGATGLLPLTEYPRKQLLEYLTAWETARLTPTLANQYPDLAGEYSVYDWSCNGCSSTYRWNSNKINLASPHPRCPTCKDNDKIRILSGPPANDQHPNGESGQ